MGLIEDAGRKRGYLMNSICDLTQFIVSSSALDIGAAFLVQLYVSDMVVNFRMCNVVLIDDFSAFKIVFVGLCTSLYINHWCLSRGDHRGNSVERYRRFLNKTQAINVNDQVTHNIYIQNAKISQYSWNSADIDNIDVFR